jgi:hypothetical protein
MKEGSEIVKNAKQAARLQIGEHVTEVSGYSIEGVLISLWSGAKASLVISEFCLLS